MRYHFLIWFAFCAHLHLAAEELRKLEFSVYGQYPVRGVEYLPVTPAAIEAGEEPEDPREIETHTLSRMGPYPFTGGSVIHFLNTSNGEKVGSVSIPNGSDKWLLVFLRNPRHREAPEQHPPYLIYPFNDSLSNLPNNGLVFLNISGKQLDGLLEDKRVQLNLGESGSFRVQESLPINLWARDFGGDRLLPALIKTYRFRPDHRYLMIFFPPALRGSSDLDVRLLSESTIAEASEPESE